jgi:hypothetical protein
MRRSRPVDATKHVGRFKEYDHVGQGPALASHFKGEQP